MGDFAKNNHNKRGLFGSIFAGYELNEKIAIGLEFTKTNLGTNDGNVLLGKNIYINKNYLVKG